MPQKEFPLATILVADDSESNRDLLSDLLRSEGYRVATASDGLSALEALRRQRIDLAILDVMMPYETGFAVCRALKLDPETRLTPVVLVTALSDADDRLHGIECGADDFLSKPINRAELLARVRSLLRLKHFTDELENAETVLISLALSIEAKDPYTEGHCDRLATYSEALAAQLGLSDEQRIALRRAGMVHDIGKVAVPEHILLKPGPLTPAEQEVMRQHVLVGERICAPLKAFRQVLPIIRHHHERLDGTGYPDGLRGDSIPLTARILQIADVYDALTTHRPYRRALEPRQAFVLLREEADHGWWDRSLLKEFELMMQSPVRPVAAAANPVSFRKLYDSVA